MKIIEDEIHTVENKYSIKVVRTVTKITASCSWRRAKKKAVGLFLKGTHKKRNVKWVGYDARASYSRRRRILYMTNNHTLSTTEKVIE